YKQNLNNKLLINNIGCIHIVNVFPVYEPKSIDVNVQLDKIISEGKLEIMIENNKRAINNALRESQYVVLAWGDIPNIVDAKLHNQQILIMYDLIKKHKLENNTYILKSNKYEKLLTNKKRPRHPGRNTPISKVKVKKYGNFKKNFMFGCLK